MDVLFKILVLDENSLENHAGEECGFFKEVALSPSQNELSEYELYFRGIIRSAWNDVSKNIQIVCCANALYEDMFECLKQIMLEQENISFDLIKE